jgi:hypothetical protein
MSIKVVALVVMTVGGVGAVLMLNPVDAKHAAAHSTKPTQKSGATLVQQMPNQRSAQLQPESVQARTGSRWLGHQAPRHQAPGHQAPPGQPVTVNHDFSQHWSDDTGWEGTWDDDVPRHPQHIRPSVQGHESGNSREQESGVNDDESSDDSGGDR